jgi:hypothetical protein
VLTLSVSAAVASVLGTTAYVPSWCPLALFVAAYIYGVARLARSAGTVWIRTTAIMAVAGTALAASIWASAQMGLQAVVSEFTLRHVVDSASVTDTLPGMQFSYMDCWGCVTVPEFLSVALLASALGALFGGVLAIPVGWIARRLPVTRRAE